ncbi:MAG: AIR synthase-related protein, partial [Trichodesmium sp. St18_bin3_1_1]|nr:AIR synthase-related protein [Trichodesmium sp. St18_bin3_1_1]
IPPIFKWISEVGNVDKEVMFNTFNMGIGFVVLVSPTQVEMAIDFFFSQGIKAYCLGEVS